MTEPEAQALIQQAEFKFASTMPNINPLGKPNHRYYCENSITKLIPARPHKAGS